MVPLGNDTITLLKPTATTDTRDNTLYWSFTSPTEVVVNGCSVQPFLPSDKLQFEVTIDRDYSRSTWRVYAPPTTDVMAVKAHDRISFAGDEYEVFGNPGTWRNRHGVLHHVQIIIQVRLG